MPTMIVKAEVEATPELVSASLEKFVATTASQQFPYPRGTFLKLNDDYLTGSGALPNMPVLVMMTGVGSLLGMVAMQKADGEIAIGFIAEQTVEGVWKA